MSSPLKPFRTPYDVWVKEESDEETVGKPFSPSPGHCELNTGSTTTTMLVTHVVVKVHEVGNHLYVGVVDPSLPDDLFQDVAQAGRKDEDGHVVLVESVEELLVAFPDDTHGLVSGLLGVTSSYQKCIILVISYLSAASDSRTTSDSFSRCRRCSTSSEWDLKYLQTHTSVTALCAFVCVLSAFVCVSHHSTMNGYFSSMLRWGSISMG